MGKAIELLTGFVTAPDTTLTALTMAAGNSLTIRNGADNAAIKLINVWNDNQTAGLLRIRSPQMHDNVQGLRFTAHDGQPFPLLPWKPMQMLRPQDTLTVELSGSSTSGDIETASLMVYYEDLPGIEAKFLDSGELLQRLVHMLTVQNTLSTGTSGGYSGEEAINAEFDLLRANTDYALLGYMVSAQCASVRWRGTDFGNLGVGGPGNITAPEMTSRWFINISDMMGVPAIPVFNSANAAGLLVDAAQDENGTDVTVTSILGQLAA